MLESPTADVDGVDERIDVDVTIVDGGIDPTHPDLNVAGGFNCVGSKNKAWTDLDGHGTRVAGVAAALDNTIGVVGIAPGARLWAVRVADPTGYIRDADLLCGLDWIAQHSDVIDVANLSLEGNDKNDLSSLPCGSKRTLRGTRRSVAWSPTM